jgi:cyclophilin family peptidyl-prolyl cis-trans isomerase
LDDDDSDTEEAELADRMHISGERWRKMAVFVVVVGLLAYAAITYIQRRDDREEEAARTEQHHQEGVEPPVSTTFATGDALTPVEPTCPEEPYTERAVQFTGPPPMSCTEDGVTYVATVETTRGDFEIALDRDVAPVAVNSFVFLARWHYYDGVTFHRVDQGFALEAGDPIGPQAGDSDPGYRIAQEPPPSAPYYPQLSVVMVSRAPEPNTTGAIFSVIVGDDGEALPPNYTRFGHVVEGESAIRAIEDTGTTDGTPPQDPTVIESITIDERGG